MRYRRANTAGTTYFFTVNLADRKSCLLTEHIDVVRNAMRKIRQSHPFDIIAMVVLPEHLHALWRLPEGDADFPLPGRIRPFIGKLQAKILRKDGARLRPQSMNEIGHRFWREMLG